MFGYSTALRSATQGRATFTMEFSHFAEKVGGFGEGALSPDGAFPEPVLLTKTG